MDVGGRIIVALDFADSDSAMALVDELDGAASFYKVGLELFAAGSGAAVARALIQRGLRVFVDLKLFDVPATVAAATRKVADLGADFLTVHGNDAIMESAVAAAGADLKILAVTVLTSMDDSDMREFGFGASVADIVAARARRAASLGCGGVICSGREVAALRAQHPDLTLVTPGARLTPGGDDQKRVATPRDIVTAGGDYLVVGRPIRNAANPRQAFFDIVDSINASLRLGGC